VSKTWKAAPVAPSLLLLAAAVLLVSSAASSAGAAAEQDRVRTRTVRGIVVDKDDNPVPASIVYLKNLKTTVVRTFIADDEGKYRFSGLDPNAEYEIYAEHEGLGSSKRTISSLDSRSEITINLRLDKKKGDK